MTTNMLLLFSTFQSQTDHRQTPYNAATKLDSSSPLLHFQCPFCMLRTLPIDCLFILNTTQTRLQCLFCNRYHRKYLFPVFLFPGLFPGTCRFFTMLSLSHRKIVMDRGRLPYYQEFGIVPRRGNVFKSMIGSNGS